MTMMVMKDEVIRCVHVRASLLCISEIIIEVSLQGGGVAIFTQYPRYPYHYLKVFIPITYFSLTNMYHILLTHNLGCHLGWGLNFDAELTSSYLRTSTKSHVRYLQRKESNSFN